MSMSMTYIQLIQQCTLAIWGGGVTLNFYLFFAATVISDVFTEQINDDDDDEYAIGTS